MSCPNCGYKDRPSPKRGIKVARKAHECSWCYSIIQPGEEYVWMKCYPNDAVGYEIGADRPTVIRSHKRENCEATIHGPHTERET